jgi:hypothetical protein
MPCKNKRDHEWKWTRQNINTPRLHFKCRKCGMSLRIATRTRYSYYFEPREN